MGRVTLAWASIGFGLKMAARDSWLNMVWGGRNLSTSVRARCFRDGVAGAEDWAREGVEEDRGGDPVLNRRALRVL